MNDYLIICLFIILLFGSYFIPNIYTHFKIKKKMINKDAKYVNGYVYIISNESFKDNTVKIGMTKHTDYNKRIKELYNTSVPVPFNIEYIIPHQYPRDLEKYLHKKLSEYRVNKKREFFSITKDKLKEELVALKFI